MRINGEGRSLALKTMKPIQLELQMEISVAEWKSMAQEENLVQLINHNEIVQTRDPCVNSHGNAASCSLIELPTHYKSLTYDPPCQKFGNRSLMLENS